MSSPVMQVDQVPAKEIYDIMDAIVPVLVGTERHKATMALLSLTLEIMKPGISTAEMVEGVEGASQWMCLFLSSKEPASKETIN